MGLGAQVAVTEIGESERKAVWKKDNELRFRDVEFGESVGRYLKMCVRGLKALCSSLEHFSGIENKWPQTSGPLCLKNCLKPGLYDCLSFIKALSKKYCNVVGSIWFVEVSVCEMY